MNYLCFTFSITDQKELYSEILTAHLAEAGFEMFEETDAGLNAYVQEHLFDEKRFNEIGRAHV